MDKFWMILFFYALGVISGVILWEKIDFKTIYKGNIRMKQRGQGNTQNSEVTLKTDRKQRKEAKKQAKIIKRNSKRADRAAKKLENGPE